MDETMDLTKVRNPFSKLTDADYAQYAGLVIAVDKATGKVVASAKDSQSLWEEMESKPDVSKWAKVAIPAATK